MIIVYCETCGVRISEQELQSGTAYANEDKYFHAKCAPNEAPKKASGRTPAAGTPEPGSASRVRMPRRDSNPSIKLPERTASAAAPAGSANAAASASAARAHPPAARGGPKPVVVISAAIFAVGVLILAIGLGSGSNSPSNPEGKGSDKDGVGSPGTELEFAL